MSDTPMTDEQKKEEERKGGAVIPPWMRGAADIRVGGAGSLGGSGGGLFGSGGGLLGLGGAGGAAAGSRGLVGSMLAFMQSKALLVAAIALSMFGSLFGLSAQKQSGFGANRGGGKGLFNSARSSKITLPGGQVRDVSALELARMANKGAFDSGEAAAAAGQEGAQTEDASASQAADAGAVPAGDPMAGASDMAPVAGGLPPGLGDMPKGLEGGKLAAMSGLGSMGGGGSGASMAVSGPPGKVEDTASGQTRAFSNPAGAKTISARTPINTGRTALKGANAKRLAQLSSAVGPTKAAGTEIGAATQSRAWEAAPDTGKGLGGAGLSQGSGNAAGSGFSANEGNEGGGPVNNGNSNSDKTWDDSEVAPTVKGVNWTIYQDLVDIATKALKLATLLTTIAFGLHLLAKVPVLAPYALPAAVAASASAAAAASVAMGCGLVIMAKYGQVMQGAIFAGVGGLVTMLSIMAAKQDMKALHARKLAEETAKQLGKEAAKLGGEAAGKAAQKASLDAATKVTVKEGLKYAGAAAAKYGGTAALSDVGQAVGKGLEAAPPEGAEQGKHLWEKLWTEQAPGSGADRPSALEEGIKDTSSKLSEADEKGGGSVVGGILKKLFG